MTVANAYSLKIISWKGDCSRTLEFRGDQNFYDVHAAIQREFSFDDSHLWAFYLSGEFFDADTEISPSWAMTSPSTQLAEAELRPGMQFAYVFDMGDEHRHDIEVIGVKPADAGAPYPRALERHGTPPPQYPFDPDDEDWDDEKAVEDADEHQGDEEDGEGVTDAAAPGEGEEEEDEVSPELAKLVAIEDLLAGYLDIPEEERGRVGQPEDVRRAVDALLELAPDVETLRRLGAELLEHDDTILVNLVRIALNAARDQSPKYEALVEVAVRWARRTGAFEDAALAAKALSKFGKVDEALALVGGLAVRGPLVNSRRVLLAEVLLHAHRFEEAETELRSLLAERWLSRGLRRSALADLKTVLTTTGRKAEIEALERAEGGRLREIGKRRAGVARNEPKVGPNERCPCGSGKKYKRCCGG